MLSCKTILKSVLAVSLSIPVLAFAAPISLIIDNNIKADSTSYMNGKMCSDAMPSLGAAGTTPACAKNHVLKPIVIGSACTLTGNTSNCKARIYAAKGCKGDYIADVILDISTGIKSITMNASNPGFNITREGDNKIIVSTTKDELKC